MMATLTEDAAKIVDYVGGKDNIKSLTHCATRLRFVVKDKSKVDGDKIDGLPSVIKFLESGGQEQVVIGPQVESMYDNVTSIVGGALAAGSVDEDHSEEDLADEDSAKGIKGWVNKLFALMQATFTPVLPVMAGVGLVKALSITITGFGWMSDKAPTIAVLNGIYNAFFYFLPIILSISMSKYLKADVYIGAAIGAGLLEPTYIVKLIGAKTAVNFFGIPFAMQNYSSTVFPVLIGIPIYAWIYRKLKKVVPDNYRTLVIPFVSLFVTVPFILVVVGPVAVWLGDALAKGIQSLFTFSPIIAGALLGGLWEVLVTFGLHWAIIPIVIANIAQTGSDQIMACAGAPTWACMGIAIGLLIKAKRDPKLRSVMAAAIVPVLFAGITEPIVYGALLRYKKCMAYTMICGAACGALTALVGEKITVMFFSILSLQTSINWIPGTIVGILTAVAAMILVLVFGYESKKDKIDA